MIPRAYVQEWNAKAPWPDLRQVEQDLIICRALCDLFNAPKLKGRIAFRGGTTINKLLFRKPLRYSEDIDLVQVRPERIGPTIDAVREALAWLGDCKRHRAGHSIHLVFRFTPEVAPDTALNLKVVFPRRGQVGNRPVCMSPLKVADMPRANRIIPVPLEMRVRQTIVTKLTSSESISSIVSSQKSPV